MPDVRRFLPSPGITFALSCVAAGCAWFVFDVLVRDPSTFLFFFIALGSDFVLRNATSGLFMDMYFQLLTAGRVFFCVLIFAIPALPILWLGRKRVRPEHVSLAIAGWLLFYVASLWVLFPLNFR